MEDCNSLDFVPERKFLPNRQHVNRTLSTPSSADSVKASLSIHLNWKTTVAKKFKCSLGAISCLIKKSTWLPKIINFKFFDTFNDSVMHLKLSKTFLLSRLLIQGGNNWLNNNNNFYQIGIFYLYFVVERVYQILYFSMTKQF